MNRRQKIEHIWTYYWLWIVGVVVGVSFAGYVIYHAFFTIKENWFFIICTNTRENFGNGSDLWQEYVDYTGYDTTYKNVEFNSSCFFDASTSSGTNNTYYQSFVAFVESKALDAVVMEEDSLIGVGKSGRLMDLDSEACASIKEKYGDRFVYCEPYDEEYDKDLVPVGINLSDSELMTKYNIYEENCYLGIAAYAQHLDAVEQFLDMVLESES